MYLKRIILQEFMVLMMWESYLWGMNPYNEIITDSLNVYFRKMTMTDSNKNSNQLMAAAV